MDDTGSNTSGYSLAYACIAVLLVLVVHRARASEPDLRSIPTVGSAGFLLSYASAIKFLFRASSVLQEGYDKYKLSAFKVANLNRWSVIISGSKLVEELRKAPSDEMSFIEAANEMVQIPYTLGSAIANDPYHTPILSTQLTRNLYTLLPDMRQEMLVAFEDKIILQGKEWTKVPALETFMHIISRVSNRVFIGLPLCRDPEFIALNMNFTTVVLKGAIVVSMFPKFLRPFAARIFTNLPGSISRMLKYLRPVIEERQRSIDQYGDNYPNKPNDLLSWLMSEAQGEQRTPRDLTLRILAVNFAATHSSSMSFTHALYHLAANPEYIQPLRDEVEMIVRKEGWSKTGIDRMRKVDSFLKESMRFSGLRALSMMRKALKPFTFSDGTHIPAGTFVFAASGPAHLDDSNYPDAHKFDGFRFANMHQGDGEGMKHQMVTTTADYLPWGHGRRACPGRFFASTELKMILAHIVMAYDVKFEVEGVRPADLWIEANCLPNRQAQIMFRKRQT